MIDILRVCFSSTLSRVESLLGLAPDLGRVSNLYFNNNKVGARSRPGAYPAFGVGLQTRREAHLHFSGFNRATTRSRPGSRPRFGGEVH